MADPVQNQVTTVSFKATGSGSPSLFNEITNLGADRVCQLEAPGYEMARSGRSFVGGITLVAGAIVPVVDLPTTTGPIILFNSAPDGGRVLVVKRLSFSYGSGTLAAYGSSLFAGVTPAKIATALTSNGATNFRTQSTRGAGTPLGFIDVAKTIPAGTAWCLLGGIAHGAETTMSLGYTVDVSSHPFVVPPGFALTWGVLAGLGTSAAYLFSAGWDEVEAILP